MTLAERFLLDGLLQVLRPARAVEIGTWAGGSLRRLVAHCEEVHAFDFEVSTSLQQELMRVTFHLGNSNTTLPSFLRHCEAVGRSVEFALVDGDHACDAVRIDVQSLVSSLALHSAVILVHDAANEEVRRGLESVDYEVPGVAFVDHDFFPGHIDHGSVQLWGGFSCIVVDRSGSMEWPKSLGSFYSAAELLKLARERIIAPQVSS